MSQTAHVIRGTILLILFLGFIGWAMYRTLKKSDDPPRLILKWVLTLATFGVILLLVRYVGREIDSGQQNYAAAFVGGIGAAALGLVLAGIWRHSIAAALARPLGALYDGGSQEVDQRPLYSIAMANRKRGRYHEAIAEIRKQLEKFPDDFEGQRLLAEIQVENMNDLPGAELTIQRLCGQAGHPPRTIASALNALADWHLKYSQDREAARVTLEKIIGLYPDSELAAMASQRIGHLAETEHLLAYHDRKPIVVKPIPADRGLRAEAAPIVPEVNPTRQAAEFVRHLESHPLDTEVREKLAVLYADHYQRLDLATDQLEQLISHPGQPAKRVVHWLNLLADLQVRNAADYDTVRQTVQRIIDLFPDAPVAETARNRLNLIKLELKGQKAGPTVKMGTYEQDIGLKRGLPNQP